ncbi:TAXI family TRAP transporter solute-binding subunit [Ostreibacterium oceani]|uniref:TAXI family TRAP transporter solute-binding subunit n=1 Tax=Ostreibacterium oceani TaxID=2654998 RepID=A0A6N7EUQ3_9GAMM|nr:TAXI family TRAP transporter solute-binding subunit [Ostreibacterium oceani]MPV86182.1 TAXI family TRAP transporter solute-binding subunit [Ostreibacterium oceani]
MRKSFAIISGCLVASAFSFSVAETTQVTYKSAKSTSSYYQMAVQYAEAIKAATDGNISVTVEESQGSVQNVSEVPRRGQNYLFTTPPSLVKQAKMGEEPFRASEKFNDIRALFPIPSLNMQFVVSEASGVKTLEDLSGKKYVIGKGSFSSRKTEEVLAALGIEGVEFVDVELNAAIPAMKNGQVDGFTTASSWPTPNIVEVSTALPIRLLQPSPEQLTQLGDPVVTIPAGTYKGVDYDVSSITLPVIVYTTTETSDEVAYTLTKNYWEAKTALSEKNKWWDSVQAELINNAETTIHPGAMRYYQEAGFTIDASVTPQ